MLEVFFKALVEIFVTLKYCSMARKQKIKLVSQSRFFFNPVEINEEIRRNNEFQGHL